jgi:hypothetical protein
LTDVRSEAPACHVCGEILDGDLTYCAVCDRPFHFRTHETAPGPDCGAVSINDNYLTLEYTCNVCQGKSPDLTARREPPVSRQH